MSNLMRIIKSLPLIAVLFTCVVILSSAAIFASEVGNPSSEVPSDLQLVIPEEYKDPVYEKLASGEAVRATHDIDDIYNVLATYMDPIATRIDRTNKILYGTGSSWPSTSLHTLVYYLKTNSDSITTSTSSLVTQANKLNNIYNALNEIHFILNGDYTGTVYVRPDIQDSLSSFDGQGNFITVSDILYQYQPLLYSSLQQLHADGQNQTFYLSSLNSSVNSISSSISDSHKIKWTNLNVNHNGVSLGYNNQYLTSNTTSTSFKVVYTFPDVSKPALMRVALPVYSPNEFATNSIYHFSIKTTPDLVNFYDVPLQDYFVEQTDLGTFLYLFDFRPISNWLYYFDISTDGSSLQYNVNGLIGVYSVSFDTYDYQLIRSAFADDKLSSSIGTLTNYLAAPNKVAAEHASQPVIDDTLDGFTGNGAAAAKTSDTASMKNMSSSLQSGLDTGASAGNAASVFTDNRYWGWFTQQNSDLINNPYPAPIYQPTRAPGDQIRDAYSHNQSDLDDMLRGSSW